MEVKTILQKMSLIMKAVITMKNKFSINRMLLA